MRIKGIELVKSSDGHDYLVRIVKDGKGHLYLVDSGDRTIAKGWTRGTRKDALKEVNAAISDDVSKRLGGDR